MHITSYVSLALLVAAPAASAVGCAAPTEAPDDDPKASVAHANTRAAPAGVDVDEENTAHVRIGPGRAFYNADAYALGLCTSRFPSATLRKIENSAAPGRPGNVHLVIEKTDGTWDSRVVSTFRFAPYRATSDECGGGEMLFMNLLDTPDASHLRRVDLGAMFASELPLGRFTCSTGFSLSQSVALDVRGFRFEDGKLSAPDLSLTVEGDISGSGSASCTTSWSTRGVFFVGVVPVVYQIEVGVGFQVSATRATHVSANVGTDGGSVTTTSSAFTLTPSVGLGVTFYGVVGGYVGVDFPLTVTPVPGESCSPRIDLGVNVKAGVQARLPGFGQLPIATSVGLERSAPPLGPFNVRACD